VDAVETVEDVLIVVVLVHFLVAALLVEKLGVRIQKVSPKNVIK